MPAIGLSVYSVRILLRKTGERRKLSQFTPGVDFLDLLGAYFKQWEASPGADRSTNKYARLRTPLKKRGRTIYGIVEYGEFGYQTDIVEVKSGSSNYLKATEEADLIPYYFSITIPKDTDEGIFLVQTLSGGSPRRAFNKYVTRIFHQKFPSFTLETNALVHHEIVKKILDEGIIEKLRFIRFETPTDIADAIGTPHVEHDCETELSIKAKGKYSIPVKDRVKSWLKGGMTLSDIVELKNFPFDNLKIEVEHEGKTRTLDLSNILNIRSNYDVTEDLKYAADGHPKFDSVHASAENLKSLFGKLLNVNFDD